jgi:large subunit ribosomal protein L31
MDEQVRFVLIRVRPSRPPRSRDEDPMKATIHPHYSVTTITCGSCGAEHVTRSTRDGITVDVCSECHPHYTGVARAAATGGRIERFARRRALARTPV